jgi:hypothetical protein
MEKLNSGRQTKRLVSGLMAIAFVITLSVAASHKVTAQVECIGACEAQYEACLRDQGSNPPPNGGCQAIYEACVDACVGQYASILS